MLAVAPPLEAKKLLSRLSVTVGVGYEEGAREHGMKLELMNIHQAFFHADARREVYVELLGEDYSGGKLGQLQKSLPPNI